MQTNRDITLVPMDDTRLLVIACDSCGGIGEGEHDAVHFSYEGVAALTTRVVLMEVMAAGAEVVSMTAAVCNAPSVGERILAGIEDERKKAGLDPFGVTLSTEKNIPTSQTGIGLTAIGLCSREDLRLGRTKPGHRLYAVGTPKVGQEVVDDRGEIATVAILRTLLHMPGIIEILPVGSRGLRREALDLAKASGRTILWAVDPGVDLEKSAGPCTSLLISTEGPLPTDCLAGCPVYELGTFL